MDETDRAVAEALARQHDQQQLLRLQLEVAQLRRRTASSTDVVVLWAALLMVLWFTMRMLDHHEAKWHEEED